MKFFNREKEIREILNLIETEPKLINFIYGPINSGKTALINEIVENKLNKNKYQVFFISLRGRFIEDYKSFIKVLFEIRKDNFFSKLKSILKEFIYSLPSLVDKETIKKISHGILSGIPIDKKLLRSFMENKDVEDVFVFLEGYFQRIRREGKVPVIILDELQVIGDLKVNGLLIYKLFNFFIHLTKEKHLAHVFCISSDSLFIERVYNEGKLEGRARYVLVDDFEKKKALEFIDFYSKHVLKKVLDKKEKEKIYKVVGGKPIYLISVIDELRIKPLEEILNTFFQEEKGKDFNVFRKI